MNSCPSSMWRCGSDFSPCCTGNCRSGRIEIDQPDVHFQKNAAGQGNWQDFGQHGAAAGCASSAGWYKSGSMFQSLAGVGVAHGHFRLGTLNVSDLNLDIAALTQQSQGHYGLAELKLTGQLQRSPASPAMPIQLAAASGSTWIFTRRRCKLPRPSRCNLPRRRLSMTVERGADPGSTRDQRPPVPRARQPANAAAATWRGLVHDPRCPGVLPKLPLRQRFPLTELEVP